MKMHLQTRYVLFFVSMSVAALVVLYGERGCHGQQPAAVPAADAAPAADPAAEVPAEPQVPILLRTFREVREYKGPDGEMIPIEENRRIRQPVVAMLTAGKFANPAEDQKMFDDYFRWRIAEMTWVENLPKLSDKRVKLKRDLVKAGKIPDSPVHEKLNEKLLSVLQSIAMSDDYHPAVRCNCALLIGMLDQREATDNNGAGLVPLPDALPVLVSMANDPKLLDCVRISALLGVARHSEHDMAPPERKKLIELFIGLVGTKQPGGVGTIGGNGWLRRRAAEGLGTVAIKWPEANTPQVVGALLSLVADEEASLVSRSEAAKSIGAIDRGALNANAAELAKSVGGVAVGIAKRGPVPDTAKLGIDYLSYLYLGLLTGLKGAEPNRGLLPAASDADTKAFINELIKKIEEMLSVTTEQRLQEPTRIERLDSLGDRLEEWLKKAGLKVAGAG